MRGRSAQRQGHPAVARQALEEALSVAKRVPNVMREHIERELALRDAPLRDINQS